ncbi:leucine-rich repeat protein FLOR 1 [Quercus suber]|uniref:leucine-rich repeat protein FLOR 1 n=1 Tax=Quercus suber TaxID=58331 RepID=UPI0032E04055
MGGRTGTQLFLLLLLFMQYLFIALTANDASNEDFKGLLSLQDELKNTPNWKGSADPCDNWEGIRCTNSRVTSLILTSMYLMGKLSSEISQLSELQTLLLVLRCLKIQCSTKSEAAHTSCLGALYL